MVMPMRLKTPRSARLHCAAIKSFAPGRGRSRAGLPEAAPVRPWGDVAISQASLLAQALHKIFINGLSHGAVQHEISFGRSKEACALAGEPLCGSTIKKERRARQAVCRWRHCIAKVHTRLALFLDGTAWAQRFFGAVLLQVLPQDMAVIFISAVHLYSSLKLTCTARQLNSRSGVV